MRGAGAIRGRQRYTPIQDPALPAAAAAKFLQLCPLRSEGALGLGALGPGA